MFRRENYIKRLEMYAGRSIVKFITGVRRAGKSTLMQEFIEELRNSDIAEQNIIYIDFEGLVYSYLEKGSDLQEIVSGLLEGADGHAFVFLDEMRCFQGWPQVISELMQTYDCEFYISTSNRSIFRENYQKVLNYNYVWINVYPLSFGEYLEYLRSSGKAEGREKEELLRDYIRTGAMPGALELSPEQRRVYYRDLCAGILLRDVVAVNNLRDVAHIDKILNYLMSNLGETFSPKALRDHIREQGLTISVDTVYSMLKALTDSGLIYRVPRFDIKAEKVLETQEKYYFCDPAIRGAVLGDEEIAFEKAMENVLFMELLTRDFKIYVGKYNSAQIDFMAVKADDRTYLNVCELLGDHESVKREFGPLQRIRDNYFKMVLTMDRETRINKGGIMNYPLTNFLAQE